MRQGGTRSSGGPGRCPDPPDEVTAVNQFEKQFLEFLDRSFKKLLVSIVKEKTITTEIETGLKKAVAEFKKSFSAD